MLTEIARIIYSVDYTDMTEEEFLYAAQAALFTAKPHFLWFLYYGTGSDKLINQPELTEQGIIVACISLEAFLMDGDMSKSNINLLIRLPWNKKDSV